jgi:alcohol dehydrogenase class IV
MRTGYLVNAKLGAMHGFAGLLPHISEVNLKALRSGAPESEALNRCDEIAWMVTAVPTARAEDGVAWVRDLCLQLKVPPPAKHGIKAQDFAAIVEKAHQPSSMKGNPTELTADELLEILKHAV